MRVPFIKMHGLSNDFVVLDTRRSQPLPLDRQLCAAIADRHRGIGCDQLIVLEASALADLKMRIFNPDGLEATACGNASRAVGLLEGGAVSIETVGGVIKTQPEGDSIRVDMGSPRFKWEQIPLSYPMDTQRMPVAWDGLAEPSAVNVGNPHVVFVVDDVDAVPLDLLGPEIENDPLFPQRVNVNCVEVVGSQALKLRVWERGAGLTRACGTGACASAVVAIRRRLVQSPVTVSLPGGALIITWDGTGPIGMTGPAAETFRGSFRLEDLA